MIKRNLFQRIVLTTLYTYVRLGLGRATKRVRGVSYVSLSSSLHYNTKDSNLDSILLYSTYSSYRPTLVKHPLHRFQALQC